MTSYTQYKDPTDTTRTASPVIWADCPTQEILHDPAAGIHIYNDFTGASIVDGADALLGTPFPGLNVSSSVGVTFDTLVNEDFGVAQVAANDADEDGFTLFSEGFARFGAGASDKVWFEARFQVPSVADSVQAFFLGFVETTIQPDSVLTLVDGSGIPDASEDFVGFSQIDTDGNVLEAIYQEGGQTRVNVGDALTIVATTNYKVGLKYTGASGDNGIGKVEYFLNGAIVQTYHVLSTDNFPDVNHLGLLFAHKTTAAGAVTFNLDWIRAAAVGGNT